MATVIRTEKRKRGFFGMVFLWVFLLFNAGMAAWMFSSITMAENSAELAAKGEGFQTAVQAGATAILAVIWLIGAIITGLLALLTRGGRTVITETIQNR